MSPSDLPIQALVFDFGGVFTQQETSDALLRSYDLALGLPPGTLRLQLTSGEAWELASTGQISEDEYWARTGAAYADRLPPEFAMFRQGVFWAEPIDEAMVALAHRLRPRYRLALCSNALHDLPALLDVRPEVRDLFDVTIISVLVGLRKPDPAIFELTAARLGLPLAACLLIDDKPRNVAAAQAIGMSAIRFVSVSQLTRELVQHGLL